MANLIISGGVTLSGGVEAGFGSSETGPVSFLGSAKTYGLKSTSGLSPILGATALIDTMQYTIENDLLDFSFDLRQQPTTGNIETNEANQWYGVPLPAGYTFGDLSSYPDQATTHITYKKLGVGAVDWNATSGSGNTAFILADTSRNMFVPVYQNYLGQYTFVVTNNQFLTWTAFRLNFSVTDVPLVSI